MFRLPLGAAKGRRGRLRAASQHPGHLGQPWWLVLFQGNDFKQMDDIAIMIPYLLLCLLAALIPLLGGFLFHLPDFLQKNRNADADISDKADADAVLSESQKALPRILPAERKPAPTNSTTSPSAHPTTAVGADSLLPTALEKQPRMRMAKNPSRRSQPKASTEAACHTTPDLSPAPEGRRRQKTNYAVVRSEKLRKAAIEIHGRNCSACGLSFDERYGKELAQGYIEIHHLNNIAAGVRNTDPATDLAPLCANCHAMADLLARHHPSPPCSIGELRKMLFPSSSLPDVETLHPPEVSKPPVEIEFGSIRKKIPKNDS